MALVYKSSDTTKARAYERSPGMEPNPGVSHLTVVNPSGRRRRRVSENPLQWVEGRGQRHRHASPKYKSLKQALGWKKRHPKSDARLYPVDDKGTILTRPVSKKLLSNRRSGMAYNIGALRRAMRSNPRGRSGSAVSERAGSRGVKVSSPGRRRKPKRNTKRSGTRRRRPTANRRRRTSKRTSRRRRSGRRRTSRRGRRRVRRNSAAYRGGWERTFGKKKRRSSKRTSKRGGKRRMTKASRSAAAKKGWAKRRRASGKGKARTSRRGSKRRSTKASRRAAALKGWRKRRSTRRVKGTKLRVTRSEARRGVAAYKKRTSKAARSRRAGTAPKRRTSRGKARRRRSSRRGSRRRASSGYYMGRRRVRRTGREYVDKYLSKGYMPAVARVRRSSKHRSGRPSILSYPIAKGRGRLSKRRTSRKGGRRSRAIGASHRGTRARRMTANRRRRRSSRRRSSRRRRSRPGLYRNRRRRSRRTSRRGSRRRRSRRRLSRNMLAASKVKYGGRGKYRMGRARGRLYQVVEYGPKSKGRPDKKGRRKRLTGYPVLIPASVSERAYVRKYRFGGAAKDSHRRAKTSGYAERKRHPRRRVSKNRRTSMRRNSRRRRTRRNPRYVVANRRRGRRRRLRRNQFFGADLMKDVVTPVIGGTAGFVAARFLSNGLANIEAIRGILDKDKPAADAENTKIAANVLGIIATLGLSTKVKVIKDNQGALITGMGLALTDRLLGRVTGDAAAYLSGGFGEYVSSPLNGMGEYVSSPLNGLGEYVSSPLNGLGAYVETPGFGEYVDQPLSGLGNTLYAAAGLGTEYATAGYAEGVDPANMAGVDGLMDVMEAAAGTGQVMEAAAGMGTLYAAAGLGAEEDQRLKKMYAREQPPFASIHTPTDLALPVNRTMPYARPVPTSLVTPEGKGYAGGLYARHLFAGMF